MTELEKAKAFNREIREALQIVFGALNQGQQNKLMKDAAAKALFERYGVGA